jgi:MATE family multidrug resistance protein
MKVAGSTDLNAEGVELYLVVFFKLAFLYGVVIVFAIFVIVSESRSLTNNGNLEGLKLLLRLSLSIPVLYLQIARSSRQIWRVLAEWASRVTSMRDLVFI